MTVKVSLAGLHIEDLFSLASQGALLRLSTKSTLQCPIMVNLIILRPFPWQNLYDRTLQWYVYVSSSSSDCPLTEVSRRQHDYRVHLQSVDQQIPT